MTGAGGHTVASILADYLQMHVPAHDRWIVFDQSLVEKVLEDHHIDKRLAGFMEEGHKSMLMDSVEEWMGLHPSTWTLVQQTNAAILQLAKMGNVILVGRGATVITNMLKNVFHVRLVGSLEKRIEYGQQVFGLDRKAALNFIKKRDEGRKRYLKDNFDVDVDDPLLYHVIINTDLVQYDEAARLIGDEVIKRFKLDSHVRAAGSENLLVHG
jgi:cytidylate kinase